jgi:preprotein translocase subunit SecA
MNEQRKVIYKLRRDILNDHENMELVLDFIDDFSVTLQETYRPEKKSTLNEWNWDEINSGFQNIFKLDGVTLTVNECSEKYNSDLAHYIKELLITNIKNKFSQYDDEQIKLTLREVLLSTFDSSWKDHLLNMDHLKEGINLRSYGQKDPLVEYKREAFDLYEAMRERIKQSVLQRLFQIRLYSPEEIEELKRQHEEMLQAQLEAHKRSQELNNQAEKNKPITRGKVKVGRNDACPCGSGKKFKHCHGA